MSKKNLTAERIVKAILDNPALLAEVINGLTVALAVQAESTSEHVEWYDMFRSEHTTVTVKSSTVQVAVERGHASEWKAQLRAAGFRWSKNARCYWAWLDDEKRAEIARRNAENDAATEGMTSEQRRAYWAERRTRKTA